MFSALFKLVGHMGHFLWDLLGAVANLAWDLFSALVQVVTWPVKAVAGLVGGAARWTPLFLMVCGVLFLLVAVCAGLAVVMRLRRR